MTAAGPRRSPRPAAHLPLAGARRPSGCAWSPTRTSRSSRRPASSSCSSRRRYDGLESDPVDFYTAVKEIAGACGSTGWVSSGRRRPPLAGRAVRRRGPAGGVGRGHRHPPLVVVRPDRQGGAHRRRLHAERPLELLLRLRPLPVGAARRPGVQRRGPGRRLPDLHGAARATTRSRTSGTSSACAAPAPTTSSSRTCSCPRRSRCRCPTPAAASARARRSTPPTSTSCRSTRSSP